MPTLIALAKILLGAVSVAGVGTVSAFVIKNSIDNGSDSNQASQPRVPSITPTKLSVVVVKAPTASNTQTASQLSVSGADQPYKCRLKDEASTNTLSICNLVELSISNKWIDLAGIKQATQSITLSLESLKDTPKQFKLEVSEELFAKVTPTTTKIIELVSTTDPTVVHAELTTLFKVDGNTVDYNNVSTLLGRATSEYAPIDAAKTNQCPLTSDTALSTNHTCTFKSFGSSTASPSAAGYSTVTDLNIEATDSTSLTADKYYFVNYSTAQAKSTLASLSTVHANEVATSASVATNKTTLDNVVPVIFNGSSEHKTTFILSETPAFKGVVVKKDPVTSPKTLTFNTQSKTYKCKYGSNTTVNCDLAVIPFTSSKTSHNTSDIKTITTTPAVTIADNVSANSYYKVEVDSSFLTTFKTGTTPKSIEILDETNGSKRLFTLDILYSIDDDAAYEAQSSYIVKTATLATSTVSFADGDKKYCLFAATDVTDFAGATECEIKDLGTSIDPDQDFKTTSNATSITAENTYLVTFVKSDGITLPTAKDIKDQSLLFLQVASADDDSTKTKVATFAKANIDYALIVDGDKNNKFAFVLNKTSP